VAEAPPTGRIETVRAGIDEETATRVREFWAAQGALEGAEAEHRLAEVLCVLYDESGEVAGVNSAFQHNVALIGGRSFWLYRSVVPDQAAAPAMINAAYEALGEGFDRHGEGPIGLCVPVTDPQEMRRKPEPIWPDTDLFFAGYAPDGSQLRVRYFQNAVVGPGLPNSPTLEEAQATDYSLPPGCRVEVFADSEDVSSDDVLALWQREGAMPEAEARRRIHEVLNVVIHEDDGLVALSTAYLERNAQLRMDLWYFRVFVSTAHRHTHIATQLNFHNRDLLEGRFVSGDDTRAGGIAFALENQGMAMYYNLAVWLPADYKYIGDNEAGDHVRVHYFPGAEVPEPS
jgi:hypothetical protein